MYFEFLSFWVGEYLNSLENDGLNFKLSISRITQNDNVCLFTESYSVNKIKEEQNGGTVDWP